MTRYKCFTAVHKVLHAPGEGESEKMWQFAKGRGLKITRDVAHFILIFYYAYKI